MIAFSLEPSVGDIKYTVAAKRASPCFLRRFFRISQNADRGSLEERGVADANNSPRAQKLLFAPIVAFLPMAPVAMMTVLP